MVYRYSWLAAFGALAFAFYLLNGLLRPTVSGPPWQFIAASGVALGIIITWTAVTYRLRTIWVVLLNLGALLIAVMRIAAPETTVALLPTLESFRSLDLQFEQAMDVIRNGIEPVIPLSGIVVIVTAVLWGVGALMAWGLTTNHPYVGVVPPLVLSLQFATMDRSPTTLVQIVVFVALVGAAIYAINIDERDLTAGRMSRRGEYPSQRNRLAPSAAALLGVTFVASVAAVGAFDTTVPRDGVLTWRTSTGLTGNFFGSVSYNPFIGIQQSLVSQSNTPVFLAEVDGDVPADQVYFRLVTMETFNGGQFYADRPKVAPLEDETYEVSGHAFAGPEETVRTDITIDRLTMDWLPGAYSPIGVQAEDNLRRSIRVRNEDGSIRLDGGRSFRGMQYSVESEVPQPNIAVLAADPEGNLSASFNQARAAEEEVPDLAAPESFRELPPEAEKFLAVPEDLDPGVEALAREQTRNLTTNFERALALESWFHSPAFTYSTEIDPGHAATDLEAWLLDPASPNYHVGYCENFATAMAIMARTLEIPSRVVLGFTPGEQLTEAANTVVVRDRNAHAWVELWMGSQGWVRFDPTPRSQGDTPQTFELLADELGFDLREYLDVPDPLPIDTAFGDPLLPELFIDEERFVGSAGESGDASSGLSLPAWWNEVAIVLGGFLVLFGFLPFVKWWRRRRRLVRLRSGDISAAWEDVVSRLTDLGEPPQPTLTPDEVAQNVDPVMAPLAAVYGRAVYGPTDSIGRLHVDTATESLERTTDLLKTRYSPGKRLVSWYRPGTVMPTWMKRNGRNGNRRG